MYTTDVSRDTRGTLCVGGEVREREKGREGGERRERRREGRRGNCPLVVEECSPCV